ncbi:Uncharacterised protein [Mycobacteroides abscessus subsp. abscessus]|nr:Uncharacterised protein [Mycobacteroides abscessus subsp. abscessus]
MCAESGKPCPHMTSGPSCGPQASARNLTLGKSKVR